jgi:hypothetical protein
MCLKVLESYKMAKLLQFEMILRSHLLKNLRLERAAVKGVEAIGYQSS